MTPVKIIAKSGPVNRPVIAAAALGGSASLLWPTAQHWQDFVMAGALASGAAILLMTAGRNVLKDYRLRKNIAISQDISDSHGSAREATPAERSAAGMDQPSELLGLDHKGRPVWRPRSLPFSIIEMPPGVGKSICYVMTWIISRATGGYSLVIADPKRELFPMLSAGLRRLGFEVWAVNPAGGLLGIEGEVELGAFQAVIDAVHGEAHERKNAVRIAMDYAVILYPLNNEEKNPYFAHGSRRVLIVAILSEAFLNPAECTPSALYSLIADPIAFKKRLALLAFQLEGIDPNDALVAFLKVEALNLIDRAKKNEENFGSFVEGASQRLLSFNPVGHLSGYGERAFHRLGELRERQVIVFIMSPLTHTREFAPLVSLLNYNILEACKSKPHGHKVHIVAEEALNYRFSELTSDMETLRGLGVSMDFFIQGFAGLEKAYGRDAARSIEAYSDVRITAGLNSPERAKAVSETLSDTTLRKQDFSYQSHAREISIATSEFSRPLMKPNEVLSMERGHAWVFVRGMNPMKLRMVHYGEVDWWRDYVAPSPISGTRLYSKPVLTIAPYLKPETQDE
ncbi:hypothetical protein JP75_20395 [Devosia riboflavina]|uniref:Conjugal transfer protein TraG n=1 Tax=Devosia riboflavina TaxID=46914 RepID=A0A087LY30_9HYPH|nr:type IV secretory system conjugative DNA transfer family protein [Devosia riboflavina]KFL29533.1 hypothetical protein JP75_20395 [Devosia riboflavina]